MPKPKWIGPLTSNPKVRMALVTKSGFGKTVFAGTAPRALFLTTDPEGTLSAKKWGSTAEEWRITSWQDPGGLTDAYNWLLKEGHREYDWIIHDNATEEQQLAMKESIDTRMKARPNGEQFVPEKADYQKSQNAFIDSVKKFMTIPCHQIWTVHRLLRETDDGVEFYTANIQGQNGAIAEQFLGYMNIIGMGEVVEKENKHVRRLFFDHYKQYRGKDRFQALGRYQDNLTVPKMMELLKGDSTPVRRTAARKTTTATRRRSTTA